MFIHYPVATCQIAIMLSESPQIMWRHLSKHLCFRSVQWCKQKLWIS